MEKKLKLYLIYLTFKIYIVRGKKSITRLKNFKRFRKFMLNNNTNDVKKKILLKKIPSHLK